MNIYFNYSVVKKKNHNHTTRSIQHPFIFTYHNIMEQAAPVQARKKRETQSEHGNARTPPPPLARKKKYIATQTLCDGESTGAVTYFLHKKRTEKNGKK